MQTDMERSRTSWWRAGIGGVVLACMVIGCGEPVRESVSGPEAGTETKVEPAPPTPYLEAARKAAVWIEGNARPTEAGLAWLQPIDRSQLPEQMAGAPAELPFEHEPYKGNSGVVRFWLEAHAHTGDESYLEKARLGGDHMLASLPGVPPGAEFADFYSLHVGWGGVLWTLEQLHVATGDERYRAGALRLLDQIHALAIPDEASGGVHWSEFTELFYGNAGYGLLLLWAAETYDHPASLELAKKAGLWLLGTSYERPGGVTWPFEKDNELVMPNFSHGTAGNAYFLASLHQATGEQIFLDGALAGAGHLLEIAETNQGQYCLVFHHEGEGEERHYLGYCHGPVGTTRLFERLYQVTGDEQWREWVDRGTRAIVESGIPEERTPGFWDNVSQCCGSAGVIEHMVAQYRRTGDAALLDFARRMADDMVARATEEGGGLKWIQAEHRKRPELLQAQVGFMQGAAGIGVALLHLDAAARGLETPRLVFVDDPWT